MPARKMRVELFDTEGNRYSISFEGEVTRDKALRLLDMVELLGGMPSPNRENASSTPGDEGSKYERVRTIIHRNFPLVWFSSREIQAVYEQELKEPIGLSTVATYLSRMAMKGIVLKLGGPRNLKYRSALNLPTATVKQK